jgi:hypothetical protein
VLKSSERDARSSSQNYGAWLAAAVSIAAFTGLALAVALSVVFLALDGVELDLNLSFELSRLDGLWFLLLLPASAVLLAVVASPLAYLLQRLALRPRRRPPEDPSR